MLLDLRGRVSFIKGRSSCSSCAGERKKMEGQVVGNKHVICDNMKRTGRPHEKTRFFTWLVRQDDGPFFETTLYEWHGKNGNGSGHEVNENQVEKFFMDEDNSKDDN